jgi:hypothetical protein
LIVVITALLRNRHPAITRKRHPAITRKRHPALLRKRHPALPRAGSIPYSPKKRYFYYFKNISI